jgi:hypothetical protein
MKSYAGTSWRDPNLAPSEKGREDDCTEFISLLNDTVLAGIYLEIVWVWETVGGGDGAPFPMDLCSNEYVVQYPSASFHWFGCLVGVVCGVGDPPRMNQAVSFLNTP